VELERHRPDRSDLSRLVGLATVLFALTGLMLWISDRPYASHLGSYGYGYGYGYDDGGYGAGQHVFYGGQVNWAWTAVFLGGLLAMLALSIVGYLLYQRRKYRKEERCLRLLGMAATSDPELGDRSRYLAVGPAHRCSDADRALVASVVEENYAVGTLEAGDMTERLEALHLASTLGELGRVLRGLRWRWPDLAWFCQHPRWMEGLASSRCAHGCCRYDHGCLAALNAELARLRANLLPSEAERRAVCDTLIDAVAQGRLRLDELDERVEQVESSRSGPQLAEVVADLPGSSRQPASRFAAGALSDG
jgi:hypothetical protein